MMGKGGSVRSLQPEISDDSLPPEELCLCQSTEIARHDLFTVEAN